MTSVISGIVLKRLTGPPGSTGVTIREPGGRKGDSFLLWRRNAASVGPKAMTDDVAELALSRWISKHPLGKTLVVLAAVDTDLAPVVIWRTWAEILEWLSMSPLVSAARWGRGQPWRVGSDLVQDLDLGFSLGERTVEERVLSIDPGTWTEWGIETKGLQTPNPWRFEPVKGSRTRITNVEVFHRLIVGVAKAMVTARWQRLFQAHVDGLITTARERA
jgi:hypothetical protein